MLSILLGLFAHISLSQDYFFRTTGHDNWGHWGSIYVRWLDNLYRKDWACFDYWFYMSATTDGVVLHSQYWTDSDAIGTKDTWNHVHIEAYMSTQISLAYRYGHNSFNTGWMYEATTTNSLQVGWNWIAICEKQYEPDFFIILDDTKLSGKLSQQYQRSRWELDSNILIGRSWPDNDYTYMREIRIWKFDQGLTEAEVEEEIMRQKGITYKDVDAADYPPELVTYFHFTAEEHDWTKQDLPDLVGNSNLDLNGAHIMEIDYTNNPELNTITLCPPGQFQNSAENGCLECHAGCSFCDLAFDHCYSCHDDFTYDQPNHDCLGHICYYGTYYKNATDTCEACTDSSCADCENLNGNDCRYCNTGFTFEYDTGGNEGECTADASVTCPGTSSLHPSLNVCQYNCPMHCDVCTENGCNSCIPGYRFKDDDCVVDCGTGWYNKDKDECDECDSTCEECDGGTSTDCTLCPAGDFLQLDFSCSNSCTDGYFENTASRVCEECSSNCLTCQTTNSTCTSCDTTVPMYLFEKSCYEECPNERYWENGVTFTCDACDAECNTCETAADDCTSCVDPYLFQRDTRKCIVSCDSDQYEHNEACYDCQEYCQICNSGLHSDCTECKATFYLQMDGTTCLPNCPEGQAGDNTLKECVLCQYFCNLCTSRTYCTECADGYITVGDGTCLGQYDHKAIVGQPINLQFSDLTAEDFDEYSVELWARTSDPSSIDNEVIMGMSPVKIRKKGSSGLMQIFYGTTFTVSYCETPTTMLPNVWHHYSFSLKQKYQSLKCYFDGVELSVGSNPLSIIASSLEKPTELVYGFTTVPGTEAPFQGYVKEFRFWNYARTEFQLEKFKSTSFTAGTAELFAYYRFDEDWAAGKHTEYGKDQLNTNYPVGWTVEEDRIDFNPFTINFCQAGFYSLYNTLSQSYQCLNCDSECAQCDGPTNYNCISCPSGYAIIEADQECVEIVECTQGQLQNPFTFLCEDCNKFCLFCEESVDNCPACKSGYFKDTSSTDCFETCQNSETYGNKDLEVCYKDPKAFVDSPKDGDQFGYGDFIVLQGSHEINAGELDVADVKFGWKVLQEVKENGLFVRYQDLSPDATKMFHDQNPAKVHIDSNIIAAETHYLISYYIEGNNSDKLVGLYAEDTIRIYIGKAPQTGSCTATVADHVDLIFADDTNIGLTVSDWSDSDGIFQYSFYFSYDNGEIYVPLTKPVRLQETLSIVLTPIYKSTNVIIKCEAEDVYGFKSSAYTKITALANPATFAHIDLQDMEICEDDLEVNCLNNALSLNLLLEEFGSLPKPQEAFEIHIEEEMCDDSLCNDKGSCHYIPLRKSYHCECQEDWAGRNCTFSEVRLLAVQEKLSWTIGNYTAKENVLFLPGHKEEFTRLVIQRIDGLTFDMINSASKLVYEVVSAGMNKQPDAEKLETYMNMISSIYQRLLIELYDDFVFPDMTDAQDAIFTAVVDRMGLLVKQIVDYSRYNMITPINSIFKLETPLISFKQQKLFRDSSTFLTARDGDNTARIKVSENNFEGIDIDDQYLYEMVEYGINIHDQDYRFLATNPFEINFYDESELTTPKEIKDMKNPFEISFPVAENHNLTSLATLFNSYNKFSIIGKETRSKLVLANQLNCTYFDEVEKKFKKDGCAFQDLTEKYFTCTCNHTTFFASTLIEGEIVDKDEFDDSTRPTDVYTTYKKSGGTIELHELLVAYDQYWTAIKELYQHKRPSFFAMLIKPGFLVVFLFWFCYLTGITYYSGRDKKRRYNMTKDQNREDLAEKQSKNIQQVEEVMREMLIRGFKLNEEITRQKHEELKNIQAAMRHDGYDEIFIEQATRDIQKKNLRDIQKKMPQTLDDLSKTERKELKQRALKKVFGRVGTMSQRASRIMKKNGLTPDELPDFFWIHLKNFYWVALISKTSKIAPRHARLTLMYLGISIQIFVTTAIYATGFQFRYFSWMLANMPAILVQLIIGHIAMGVATPFLFLVAIIFRMPHSYKQQVEGVRMSGVNKVFIEIDRQMQPFYAVGYAISYLFYVIMTLFLLFFNYLYPTWYILDFIFSLTFMFIFDVIGYPVGISMLQLLHAILSKQGAGCCKGYWKLWEYYRYVKNMRG